MDEGRKRVLLIAPGRIRQMVDESNELSGRRARVFISCGQSKESTEVETARSIAKRLQELGFDPYIAVEEQTLSGLRENLFRRLQDSEYFIFVDFKREKVVPRGHRRSPIRLSNLQHRGSLFSHQELAIASYLNIPVMAFQENGVKPDDGIIRFLQTNATPFSDRHLLPNVIADEVQERKWNPYSRNELVLERDPEQHEHHLVMSQHGGVESCRFYYVDVRNLHHRKTATNCYVYLEKALRLDCPAPNAIRFKSVELKWSGYTLPNAHILPQTARPFDAFSILHARPTELRFISFSDSLTFGRPPIQVAGEYELDYVVVSDNFPIVRISLILTLSETLEQTTLRPNPAQQETF